MTTPAAPTGPGPDRYLHHRAGAVTLYLGDALDVLRELPDQSVHCVVTSPPYYGMRDYGVSGQLGLEPTPEAYVDRLCAVFAQVRRVLAATGTCWLNLGDGFTSVGGASGAMAATGLTTRLSQLPRPEAVDPATHGRWRRNWGLPPKNLLGLPWRVAFALQDQGWWLFSGGGRSSGAGSPHFCSSALILGRYELQQWWCKRRGGVSSISVVIDIGSARDWVPNRWSAALRSK